MILNAKRFRPSPFSKVNFGIVADIIQGSSDVTESDMARGIAEMLSRRRKSTWVKAGRLNLRMRAGIVQLAMFMVCVLIAPCAVMGQFNTEQQENQLRDQAKKLESQGDYDPAIEMLRKAIDLKRRRLRGSSAEIIKDQNWLIQLQGKARRAKIQMSNAILTGRQLPNNETGLREQARKLESEGRIKAAITVLRKAMDLRRKRLANRERDTLQDENWMRSMLNKWVTERDPSLEYRDKWFDRKLEFHNGGKLADEVHEADRALAKMTQEFGEQSSEVLAASDQLTTLIANRNEKVDKLKTYTEFRDKQFTIGEIAQASLYARLIFDLRREIYGEDDLTVAIAALEAANLEMSTGTAFGNTEPMLKNSLEVFTRIYGENHWRVADTRVALRELEFLRKTSPIVVDQFTVLRAKILDSDNLLKRSQFFSVQEISREVVSFLQTYAPSTTLTIRARAQLNEAAAYRRLGDFQRSIPIQRAAIDELEQIYNKEHPETIVALQNQFAAYLNLGDLQQAIAVANRAMQVCEKVWGQDHIEYANCRTNLAAALTAVGDYENARPLLVQSLKFAETDFKRYSSEWTNSLHHLAEVEFRTGRLEEAKRLLEHVLKNRLIAGGRFQYDYCTTLSRLATVNSALGKSEEAEEQFRDYLEAAKLVIGKDHPDYARQQAGLALVLRDLGRQTEALTELDSALTVMRNNLDATFGVLSERQQLLMTRDGYQMLSDYTSLAIELEQPPERLYNHVLAWKGAVLEQQRQIRSVSGDAESADLIKKLQETSRQLAALALATHAPEHRDATQSLIADLSQKKERLESELAQRGAENLGDEVKVDLARLQSILPTDVLLVDYHSFAENQIRDIREARSSESRLMAFMVASDQSLVQVQLGRLEPIVNAGNAWRRAIMSGEGANRGLTLLPQTGDAEEAPQHQLRRLLWEPIEKHLPSRATILISPEGEIARLPLTALPGKESGKYLIEEQRLVVVPVPKQLPELLNLEPAESVSPEMSMALFGDVDFSASPGEAMTLDHPNNESLVASTSRAAVRFGDAKFGALPGTEREITAIAELHNAQFRSKPLDFVRGTEATEQRFRELAPQTRFLHMATHGFFASRPSDYGISGTSSSVFELHPGLLSGVALAGANRGNESESPSAFTDDGILTALEVSTMPLAGLELAVLSACETGLGESSSGEGLLSLQRSFQAAGAGSTLTSLWKVDDSATETLMVEFYRNLWQKKLSKLEALRQAQLTMLNRYDPRRRELQQRGLKLLNSSSNPKSEPTRLAPFYWAAFVLSGDWR